MGGSLDEAESPARCSEIGSAKVGYEAERLDPMNMMDLHNSGVRQVTKEGTVGKRYIRLMRLKIEGNLTVIS